MSVLQRNNVTISGQGEQPMLFAHGFGCDQQMWRFVAPAFAAEYKIILYDQVGAGHSDVAAYDPSRYSTLQGYADDLLEICHALDVHGAIFVGHSVSAMIGVLAAIKEPERFAKLVLIGPRRAISMTASISAVSPRRILRGLLDSLESNYLGWSGAMAPVIMGNPDRPELGGELTSSFCRTDPAIAKQFAQVTFLSDNRADLPKLSTPALILQCSADVIAPEVVGQYVHRALANSSFTQLQATGHCPNLSAPRETIAAMRAFLQPSTI